MIRHTGHMCLFFIFVIAEDRRQREIDREREREKETKTIVRRNLHHKQNQINKRIIHHGNLEGRRDK